MFELAILLWQNLGLWTLGIVSDILKCSSEDTFTAFQTQTGQAIDVTLLRSVQNCKEHETKDN